MKSINPYQINKSSKNRIFNILLKMPIILFIDLAETFI